jgi:hypothetical protein
MKPRADRASEGRTNPKGIPVLHVATDQYTALVEVRPWLGSYVSIAQFHLKRDVRVIDCSQGSAGPSAEEVERSVWSDINQAFAAPVDRQDDVADYAPTQVIAELFRRERYGGVKYRSALSKRGHNIALFDLKVADPPLVLFIGH